ncbi:hypothetical protein STEG23_020202, partial [Scotinomys teguina]
MQTSPEVLHQDLADFRVSHPDLTLLQYVDDILLTAETEQECLQGSCFSLSLSIPILDCHHTWCCCGTPSDFYCATQT